MITREYILSTIKDHKSEINNLGVHEIGLFGSYARNEQSQASDIDILIDFIPEDENYDNLLALYEYLDSLFIDQHIEIVTKNGLSPHIGPFILKEVIYV